MEEAALMSGSEWSSGSGADGGGGISRCDGGVLACCQSLLWLHRLRQVAVEEALVEEATLVTAAVGGCAWSSGGGAVGGGIHRRDGRTLGCWQSVFWLHRLRQVAVEAAVALMTAVVSGCEWSSSGGVAK